MTNTTKFLVLENVSQYTPLLYGWLNVTYNSMLVVIIFLGYKVQRGLFKMFERLGPRAINSILVPALVRNM